jgi:cytochrome c-type biogenesis protein CcmF
VVGGSLLLYAIRIPEIRSVQGFGLFSRESFMLVNNVLFAVATAGVLFGTLYPLLVDALWGAKLSVGPPFFNVMFTPLMMLVALFVGFGIMMNWKKTKLGALRMWIGIPLLTAIIMGFLFPLLANAFHWGTVVAVALGSWVILASLSDLVRKLRNSRPMWRGLPKISLSYWGMFIAHFGFAVCFIGAAVNSIESDHRDVRMVYGERQEVGGYEFELIDVVPKRGPNYNAQVGEVKVYRDGQQVTTLFPEKRHYLSDRGNVMTEAGIDTGFSRDLFVALGDHLDNRAWSMRIHHYPLVRWIWGGAIFMALGGMLAVLDRRYRMKRTRVERESDHSGVSVAT